MKKYSFLLLLLIYFSVSAFSDSIEESRKISRPNSEYWDILETEKDFSLKDVFYITKQPKNNNNYIHHYLCLAYDDENKSWYAGHVGSFITAETDAEQNIDYSVCSYYVGYSEKHSLHMFHSKHENDYYVLKKEGLRRVRSTDPGFDPTAQYLKIEQLEDIICETLEPTSGWIVSGKWEPPTNFNSSLGYCRLPTEKIYDYWLYQIHDKSKNIPYDKAEL